MEVVGISLFIIEVAPKNTAQNTPKATRAGHGILPKIARLCEQNYAGREK